MEPEFVPQIRNVQQFSTKSARIARRHPRDAVLAIELPNPAGIREKKARPPKPVGPAEIGFGRSLPKEYQGNLDHLLTWSPHTEGGYIAVLEISSPGAQGMRAGIRAAADGGVEFRFFGAESIQGALPVFAPKPAQGSSLDDIDVNWSPTVRGGVLGIEIYARDWGSVLSLRLEIRRISHIFSLGYGSDVARSTLQSGANSCVGEPAACGRVSSCSQEATVNLQFVKDEGQSYICSGTTINDARELAEKTNNALLYTAHHCISSQSVAQTLEVHFHHADTSCTNTSLDRRYKVHYGGADLLETVQEHDQSLLRLQAPLNVESLCFAGWDANPLTVMTDIVGVHHPDGGRKEWLAGRVHSFGTTSGEDEYGPIDVLIVDTTQGLSQGGSSGSGLFFDNDDQYLLGSLVGNNPDDCTETHYGALSEFYPQIRPYLSGEDLSPPTVDDHGNSRSDATGIDVSAPTYRLDGVLDSPDDIDYFSFTIDTEGDVTVESAGSTDTIGAIYDANGRELHRDDDGGDQQNFRITAHLPAGRYYVSVEGYGGAVGNYSLTVDYNAALVHLRIIPLMVAADEKGRQGFLRIQNFHTYEEAALEITGIDVSGESYGPIRYQLGGWQSVHFNSDDIENGNPDKGLPDGLGDGEGWWHLQIKSSSPHIFATAYVRTPDGFLTSIHDTAPERSGGEKEVRVVVPIFNPASNLNQRSYLWITNLSPQTNNVKMTGVSDAGGLGASSMLFAINGRASVILSAQDLENGIPDVDPSGFGDGAGKWRLTVDATHPLMVLSLMVTPQGHITNLSTINFAVPSADGLNTQELPQGNLMEGQLRSARWPIPPEHYPLLVPRLGNLHP